MHVPSLPATVLALQPDRTRLEKPTGVLERSIPSEPAQLNLFSWASSITLTGDVIPGWSERSDPFTVYKTIGADGAMRIVDGRIAPPSYIDGWAMEMSGRSLDEVLTQVRAAVGG